MSEETKQDPSEKAEEETKSSGDTGESGTAYPFQAEVQQVLTLVIDSLYANKEVFLRELISNASDALDKGRFVALSEEGVTEPDDELAIRIALDEEKGTLTIADNGLGMSKEELVENLGTIARSGSREFLKQNADALKKDPSQALQLIGQFGVGFYSAFMVASRIDVHTLSMKPDAEPAIWRSTGAGTFHILPGDRKTPGTEIVLHLKEDQRDFAKPWRVKEVIKKYSDFVNFPIYVGDELANRSKALWSLPRSQVTEKQHIEFYRHLTGGGDDDKPLTIIHHSVDAPVQFHALLYIPNKAPFDLFRQDRESLRLYAKRVLIIENCEKLTPVYLRFLRGVVDSEDLSLNVSREMLQDNQTVKTIEQQIVKQVLRKLKELSEQDPEQYKIFWREFGKVLKEGLSVDWKNKDAIAELCRFESMNHPEDECIGLSEYVKAMPEGQEDIYYLTGASRKAIEQSPHLEAFRKKGYNVLFMVDAIDEWAVQAMPDFEKHALKSVVHGDLDLSSDDDPKEEEKPENAITAIKKVLGDRVKDVRISRRLTDSASCLVNAEGTPGANFERIMKMIDDRAKEQQRILEINPNHPIVQNLEQLVKREAESERVTLFSELLYDQALLSEGVVEDPALLVKKMQQLLTEVSQHAVKDG